MAKSDPVFAFYTDDDLDDIARHLDREAHPDRWASLQEEILRRAVRRGKPRDPSVMPFDTQYATFMLATFGGLALFGAGAMLAHQYGSGVAGFVCFAGVAIIVGANVYYQTRACRCPSCRRPLGSILMHADNSPAVRYCPYCGADLDPPHKPYSRSDDLLS